MAVVLSTTIGASASPASSAEALEIHDAQQRIRRRLGPEGCRPLDERVAHGREILVVDGDVPDTESREHPRELARPVVAVVGQDEPAAFSREREHERERRRLARGERERRGVLERSERGLERLPGRVPVAAVRIADLSRIAGRDVDGGRDDRRRARRPRLAIATRVDEPRRGIVRHGGRLRRPMAY